MLNLRLTAFAVIASLAFAVSLAADDGGFSLKQPAKPAFLYFDQRTDGGWTQSFDEARLRMERDLKLSIPFVENVADDDVQISAAAEQLIKRGSNIILGTSFGYSDAFKQLAEKHPDVAFLNASGTTNGRNLQSYYGRTYESHYLCGMAAGLMSKSGHLGFVAAHPLGVVNWVVNGFELGAQQGNKQATVNTVFIGTWGDPVKERAAALALIDQGADVIGEHVNTPTPQIVAQEHGVFGTGHHRDMSEFAPKATICSAVWVWDRYLTPEIRKIAAGHWHTKPFGAFLGIKDGGTDIALDEHLLPADAARKIMAERQAIVDGKQIFVGPLRDRDGTLQLTDGQAISDAALWKMQWYVPGVISQK
jgi:basic membrane lipoprotein Med (substrate-binding protein (PBP1-ABC) superfamily)